MKKRILLSLALGFGFSLAHGAKDTFKPYDEGRVPDNVIDLWKGYDPRSEDLEVKVIKEWKEEGVTTRYITFKVGTFKGADSRVAAYYSFPDNGKKNPAFVWTHGGGQRADRSRGVYFAKQGFATVDINWLGRELEPDIEENTDWGEVDPTQGPNFYSKAKRKHWKRGVEPDAYTIDPVHSPRNNNWFLLVVAGKRGITFLENQPEVDAERIGFSGFSMGGTITSMVAMDPRLKAVAPFVGGTGFLHEDFPGRPGTSLKVHYRTHLEMYAETVDPAAYWPHVKCPVMFISSSNDFHSGFDRIYQSMALLSHKAWRVTANMHANHGPSPEQWVLLNKWFNLHLKGIDQRIPQTPASNLKVKEGQALFSVTPDNRNQDLTGVEIYYSYDPNPITRFWVRADSTKSRNGKSFGAKLKVYESLPLYVFALCRYALGKDQVLQNGVASTMTLNSLERIHMPENLDLAQFSRISKSPVVEDFSKGLQDWQVKGQGISTYKFQSPYLDVEGKNLCLKINSAGKKLSIRLRADSKFIGHGKDLGGFSVNRTIEGPTPQNIVFRPSDFKGDKDKELDWGSITTFNLSIFDLTSRKPIDLGVAEARSILSLISMVDAGEDAE